MGCSGGFELISQEQTSCLLPHSTLPQGLPPFALDLISEVERRFLCDPEWLHNFENAFQKFHRVFKRSQCFDSLLHVEPSPVHSTLKVVRNPTTGELLDFQEGEWMNQIKKKGQLEEDIDFDKESAVMGERGLLILLLAGLCGPAANQIRKHVFVPITLSWSQAQTYCREQHTDLATVCSQEEAEQLLTLSELSLIDSAWIGLYRDDTQNWQWSNSDDFIYSNWNTGEPNNVFGVENCAIMSLRNSLFLSRGKWVDVVCSGILPFFCYEDLEPTSPPSTLVSQDPNPSDLPSTPASKDPNLSDLPSTPASKEAEPSSLPSTLISQDPNPSDLPSTPASKDPNLSDLPSTPASKEAEPSSLPSTLISQDPSPSDLPSTPASKDPNPSDLPSTPASKDHMAIGRVKLTAPKGMNLEDPKVSEAILEQIREHLSKNFPMDGVKMHWRKQDGEIFHKDEEEEEKEKCSEP